MKRPGDDNPAPPAAQRLLSVRFDDLDLEETLTRVAARDPAAPFVYVITPNVDHLLRLQEATPALRAVYEAAWLSVCDSRILRLLAARRGMALKIAPGSDITAALFGRVIGPDTPVTVIGAPAIAIDRVRRHYGLRRLAHHNPPMGFIDHPAEVAACVAFVVSHPARFVFLCVGSPRQELLAARIAGSGQASGIGLCVGVSLEFVAGTRQRAPRWMQAAHLEWLHRLLSEPRRLWRRYLLDAPRLVWLLMCKQARQGLRPGSAPRA